MDKSYRPLTILRMMLEFKQFFAWRLHMLVYRGFAPNLEALLELRTVVNHDIIVGEDTLEIYDDYRE